MIPASIETSVPHNPLRLVPAEAPADARPSRVASFDAFDPANRAALEEVSRRLRCNAEQCRIIRARLMTESAGANQICTITSPAAGEGRTTTALGLAMSFAELPGRRVLAIEADPLSPRFGRLLDLPVAPGFADWLGGRCDLDDALIPAANGCFMVMTAGQGGENRLAEHLVSPAARSRFEELRERFDHVIIDTPPISRAAEPGLIGALSDQVLLLVRMGQTARPSIDRAMRVLDGFGARPTAAILTGARSG